MQDNHFISFFNPLLCVIYWAFISACKMRSLDTFLRSVVCSWGEDHNKIPLTLNLKWDKSPESCIKSNTAYKITGPLPKSHSQGSFTKNCCFSCLWAQWLKVYLLQLIDITVHCFCPSHVTKGWPSFPKNGIIQRLSFMNTFTAVMCEQAHLYGEWFGRERKAAWWRTKPSPPFVAQMTLFTG